MVGISSPFGGDRGDGGSEGDGNGAADDAGSGGGLFDGYDEFVPENIPEPGRFLEGHDVLEGEDHLDFHDTTRELFDERTVYDMTFGYNLARLNLDTRHRDSGYRYAREADDSSVLRAEFTPTTPFCPQSDTLTKGSFRAWNGLADRHDYDLVRVRVDPMHHRADEINEVLGAMEESVDDVVGDGEGESDGDAGDGLGRGPGGGKGCGSGTGGSSRGYGADAPF